jgi:hypothetical protein
VAYQPFAPLQSLKYGDALILWTTTSTPLVVEQGSNSVINCGYRYQSGDFDITNIWDNKVTRGPRTICTPTHRLPSPYRQDGVGIRTVEVFNDGTTTMTKVLGYHYNSKFCAGMTLGSTTLRSVTLRGGLGSDTYVFNRDDGQDAILDNGAGSGEINTSQFGAAIARPR